MCCCRRKPDCTEEFKRLVNTTFFAQTATAAIQVSNIQYYHLQAGYYQMYSIQNQICPLLWTI